MTAVLRQPLVQSVQQRGGALTLDFVRDEAEFHALAPFWDDLVEQTATRSPF